MIRKLFAAVALSTIAQVGHGEVLATCGAAKGYAYFLPGELVPAKDSGWTEDAISKGSFQLIRNGDEYDIIFTDASGGTLSSKGDGARLTGTYDASGNLMILAFYPGKTVETWVFWFGVKDERVMTYSQAKYGTRVGKHSLMRAECSW